MQQRTLYRRADGGTSDQPDRTHGGKITQRYFAKQYCDGVMRLRIFERTAEIPQRTLTSVGGSRDAAGYSRKLDKKDAKARAAKFFVREVVVSTAERARFNATPAKYLPNVCASAGKR